VAQRLDYDAIAGVYDRRYEQNDFSGIERTVQSFAGTAPGAVVVEVGCGTGRWLRLLRAAGIRITGMDASLGMLVRAKAPVAQAVAEYLPYASRSIDRVFCVNAFHHFTDKRAFLGEARRVLRPGGQLMIVGLDPHSDIAQWYVYDYFPSALANDRRRYAATGQIREWMHQAGFTGCATREAQHSPARIEAGTALREGRLDRTAASQLALLTDAEYQHGIERIRKDSALAATRGTTLELTADLRLYATYGSVT
jgi:ubiquinone/menaquinone biosynthesis C-methylase UbiE